MAPALDGRVGLPIKENPSSVFWIDEKTANDIAAHSLFTPGARKRSRPSQSRLPAGSTVPIGWVAVGEPITILPPDQHDAIWARQMPLNFPVEVYDFDRTEADMVKITTRLSEVLATHTKDKIVL